MIGPHAEAGQTNTCSVLSPSTSTFRFVAWCVSLSVVNKNKLNIFSANPEWERGKRRGAP